MSLAPTDWGSTVPGVLSAGVVSVVERVVRMSWTSWFAVGVGDFFF